jgi:DNA polymerase-3 subunit gamma/tau
MSFSRKYRPQFFSDVIGQDTTVRILKASIAKGKPGAAYLFTGSRGIGKTTLARLFAKAVTCSKCKDGEPCGTCTHCLLMAENRSLDIMEIDAASNTGVDNIRELRETVKFPPALAPYKVYIIDEAHMLSIGAWNALLKTLEEPPAHVIFIFATTNPKKVPETIISRCQRFDLGRFSVSAIAEKLGKISKEEKIAIDDEALLLIASAAEGGMRDAESLFNQVATLSGKKSITSAEVTLLLGLTGRDVVLSFFQTLTTDGLLPSLLFVRTLTEKGVNISDFLDTTLDILRLLLLVRAGVEEKNIAFSILTEEERKTLFTLGTTLTLEKIITLIEVFQIAARDAKNTPLPELALEIAIAKSVDTSIDTSISKQTAIKETPPVAPSKSATPPSAVVPPAQKQAKSNDDIPVIQSIITPREADDETPFMPLDTIQAKWQNILREALRLNASLALGLTNCFASQVSGNRITLTVSFAFHRDQLMKPENRLTLEKAFDTILGSVPEITVIVAGSDKSAETKPADAKNEPLLSKAMELLGGKLIEEGA